MARRSTPPLLAAALAAAAAGCAAQADMGDLMREQRILARRLADTRADLESLRISMSRLQGRVDDLSGGARSTRMAPVPVPDMASRLQPLDQPPPRPVAPPPPVEVEPPPRSGRRTAPPRRRPRRSRRRPSVRR